MNITLSIIEMEDVFYAAVDFLKFFDERDTEALEDIQLYDYIQQMLNNKREYIIDDEDPDFIRVDITFENEAQIKAAYAFWDTICDVTRETDPELSSVAYEMYYGLILAFEDQIIGGDM